MNTLKATKTDLILVKVGGVQISQHSQILIKSDNGGGGNPKEIIEWEMGGGGVVTEGQKNSDMIFQRSLKAQSPDYDNIHSDKIWSTLFDKSWSAH